MYDRDAPPGRGWWNDRQVQVAAVETTQLAPTRAPAVDWCLPDHTDVLVVSRRPAMVSELLHRAYPTRRLVRDLSEQPVTLHEHPATTVDLAPRILVGDPDSWQASWALFTGARRHCPIVIVHADAADVRVLLAHRATPPPLELDEGEVWVVEPGEPLRRRGWQALVADRGSAGSAH